LGIKPEGKPLKDDEVSIDNLKSICQQITKRLPKAKKVILTIRRTVSASHNTLSGVISNGKDIYNAPTHQMTDIVDSVGGGDALMAGLISGLIKHPEDDQRTINFALASAVLKHTIHGDFNYATIEDVEKIMSGQGSGRISR
jgi:2-dehydro-3-deoxygluconokinase